jgi:DNA-binding GntR family transcriptional regulator
LRDTIERNALPLIATHSAFAAQHYADEIGTMLVEHHAIFDHLLAGRREAAMAALEAHVRRSLEPNIERLRRLGPLPEKLRTPFLVQVDEPADRTISRGGRA